MTELSVPLCPEHLFMHFVTWVEQHLKIRFFTWLEEKASLEFQNRHQGSGIKIIEDPDGKV